MSAQPVQVLVTIHPDDPTTETNWRIEVMGALLREGSLITQADFVCSLLADHPAST